jgi:hypothetical protein
MRDCWALLFSVSGGTGGGVSSGEAVMTGMVVGVLVAAGELLSGTEHPATRIPRTIQKRNFCMTCLYNIENKKVITIFFHCYYNFIGGLDPASYLLSLLSIAFVVPTG